MLSSNRRLTCVNPVLLVGLASFLAASGQSFTDGTPLSGLQTFTLVSGDEAKKYIVEANSAGACLFDYDNDGWVDIYLVNGGTMQNFRTQTPSPQKNALFRNLGNRRFANVTETAKVAGNSLWGMGCSVADYDGDGWLDLYVTSYGPNRLYRNGGDGSFQEVTAKAGVNDERWSTGSAWADFDGDGDLDVFVTNYIELDPDKLPEPGSPGYGSMGRVGLGCQYLGLPVMCGPRGLKGAGDSFFVNQGDGTFKPLAEELGMHDPAGYYGLGAIWGDLDDDGNPDLYVANDSTPNLLYHNKGDGSFEEVGLLSGAAASETGVEQAGMGVALGDYLNEGVLSIYVTNFSEEYNTLYRNEGNFNFTDVTISAGLSEPSFRFVGWGTFFFDYDNDGWLDLFVANGHVFPQVDQVASTAVAGYQQRNLLFDNLRNGRFAEIGQQAGLEVPAVSRGAAFADLDNDGDLDLVVNNLDSSPSLFWNQLKRPHHFLQVKLVGVGSNRFGLGARIRIRTNGQWQMREVHSGGSYLSHSDLRAHFGLGSAEVVDEVEVRWPSGATSSLTKVPADQILTITER